ncbi:hypothetical protein MHH56_16420 [Paenibacillus sp. FSL K6-3182]|uniref:hypothetical protein n=1 Tax=Paenibacillus sp. FSL K6-3182 TaxID=2921495 RepID=UPI0030CC1098
MSIEQELTQAYKQSATRIKRPEELDARIEQLYRTQSFQKQTKLHAVKKSWTLRIIVAGLLLTSMGFSTPYIFHFKDEIIDYMLHNGQLGTYDTMLAQQMRKSLEEVKQTLPTEGKAIFYSQKLKSLLPKTGSIPIVIVSNPFVWKEEKDWEMQLTEANPDLQLPDSLTETLTFIGGQKEQPFGGSLSAADMEPLHELEKRVKKEKPKETWLPLPRPVVESVDHPVYTTTYENESADIIHITMEVFTDKSNVQLRSNLKAQEQIVIGQQSATYALAQPFLYSDSDQYQSVFWMDSLADETILYTIGSPDLDMTKSELTSIAEQFIH